MIGRVGRYMAVEISTAHIRISKTLAFFTRIFTTSHMQINVYDEWRAKLDIFMIVVNNICR
jgi:hypothetical protein